GVPSEPVSAVSAKVPNLTLPAAAAGVGETVSLPEFAASTAGDVALARVGRFTDLSKETLIGARADAVIGVHQPAIAKDLDKLLIDGVEAAAGSAVAFTSDVPAAIRNAIATVLDNTGAEDPADVVVLVNPANASLLQGVTPTGGSTIGERFQNFSGSL